MATIEKTVDATVLEDGTVVLNGSIPTSRVITAKVVYTIEDVSVSDEAVHHAADKVFKQHDGLFRKLAQ